MDSLSSKISPRNVSHRFGSWALGSNLTDEADRENRFGVAGRNSPLGRCTRPLATPKNSSAGGIVSSFAIQNGGAPAVSAQAAAVASSTFETTGHVGLKGAGPF